MSEKKLTLKMKIKKAFCVFLACFTMCFSFATDYVEVQALEWVVFMEAGDALLWLLGILGIVTTGAVLESGVGDDLVQSLKDYSLNNAGDLGVTDAQEANEQFYEWIDALCRGHLMKDLYVWDAFKRWVTSLMGGAIAPIGITTEETFSNLDIPLDGFTSAMNFGVMHGFYIANGDDIKFVYLFSSDASITINEAVTGFRTTTSGKYLSWTDSGGFHVTDYANSFYTSIGTVNQYYFYSMGYSDEELQAIGTNLHYWEINPDAAVDISLDGALDSYEDMTITNDYDDEVTDTGVVDIPWEAVNEDILEELYERVAEGEITLEEMAAIIQELTDTWAWEITEDIPIPFPDESDRDEEIDNNRENSAFVISGLEKVFPFCIPWDIYDFVTLLVADPVAPVIDYPFYNPATKKNINIHIDFSVWQSVAVLFRYMEDFLLIVGLLLLARNLIGAGGDD